MIQGLKGVKYGLTVPASKNKAAPTGKPGVVLTAFGGDDSDGEHEAVPQQLARQAASKKSNNKVSADRISKTTAFLWFVRSLHVGWQAPSEAY